MTTSMQSLRMGDASDVTRVRSPLHEYAETTIEAVDQHSSQRSDVNVSVNPRGCQTAVCEAQRQE